MSRDPLYRYTNAFHLPHAFTIYSRITNTANYAKLAVVFPSIDSCFPDAQHAQYLKYFTVIGAAGEMHCGYFAARTPQAQLTCTW